MRNKTQFHNDLALCWYNDDPSRNLGRVWIGGDTDPRWCDATVKRLARDFDDWQPRAATDGLAGLPMFDMEAQE